MISAGKPEVDDGQDERRRAERLHDADEQLAPVGRRAAGRTDRRSTGRPASTPATSSVLSSRRPGRCTIAHVQSPRRTYAATATAEDDQDASRRRRASASAGVQRCMRLASSGDAVRRCARPRSSSRSSRSRTVRRAPSARFSTTPSTRSRPMRVDRALDEVVRRRVRLDDEHDAVDHRRQQVRVGQQADRRRVDDHPVERLARLVDQPAHAVATSGPPSDRTSGGRPAASVRRGETWCSGSFGSSAPIRPSLRPGRAVAPGTRVCSDGRRRSRVDEQHVAAVRLAQRQREVGGRQRLAFAGDRARDHDDLEPVGAWRVVQRRGQPPVLLARRRQHVRVDDDLLARAVPSMRSNESGGRVGRRARPLARSAPASAGGIGGRHGELDARRRPPARQRIGTVRARRRSSSIGNGSRASASTSASSARRGRRHVDRRRRLAAVRRRARAARRIASSTRPMSRCSSVPEERKPLALRPPKPGVGVTSPVGTSIAAAARRRPPLDAGADRRGGPGSRRRRRRRPAAPAVARRPPLGRADARSMSKSRQTSRTSWLRDRPLAGGEAAEQRVVGDHADRARNAPATRSWISATASRVNTCAPTPPAARMRPAM